MLKGQERGMKEKGRNGVKGKGKRAGLKGRGQKGGAKRDAHTSFDL